MSKVIINSLVNSEPASEITLNESSKQLNQFAEQLMFEPLPMHQKAKSRFWSRYEPGPLSTPSELSLTQAQAISGVPGLKKWWAVPGFREWFFNQSEQRERLTYLFDRGLDAIEKAFDDPLANLNAKVKAWEKIGEAIGYFNKDKQNKFADDDINKMNEGQLKAYLEKKGIVIKQEKILDISPAEKSEEPEFK